MGRNDPSGNVRLRAAFDPVRRILGECRWPGTVEATSYGTPALQVRGRLGVALSSTLELDDDSRRAQLETGRDPRRFGAGAFRLLCQRVRIASRYPWPFPATIQPPYLPWRASAR